MTSVQEFMMQPKDTYREVHYLEELDMKVKPFHIELKEVGTLTEILGLTEVGGLIEVLECVLQNSR